MFKRNFPKCEEIKNKGFSLLELIIAITIMAVIVGVVTPQYFKYLQKSRKATDMQTAQRLGDIFTRSLVDYPEAYSAYDNYEKAKVKVTVNGFSEKPYDVYLIMVNEDKYKYWFYGGMSDFYWKSDTNIGLYNYVNHELGFEGIMKGSKADWTRVRDNLSMVPQFKPDPPISLGTGAKIDRWRIVKRVDNGTFEIWSAADFKDGKSGGGKPCYRVWPNPDDIYTK